MLRCPKRPPKYLGYSPATSTNLKELAALNCPNRPATGKSTKRKNKSKGVQSSIFSTSYLLLLAPFPTALLVVDSCFFTTEQWLAGH